MRSAKALLGAATATATALLVMAPASAEPMVDTIAEDLEGPLQLQAVDGGAIVAETSAGRIVRVFDDGFTETLVADQGFIGGLDHDGTDIAFTATTGGETSPPRSKLKLLDGGPARAGAARGEVVSDVSTLANLTRYERQNNPDGDQTYGIAGLGDCELPRRLRPFLEPYQGIKESNPYAVGASSDGGWYVADAAANAILHVADDGVVETTAVLPVQRIEITKAVAEEVGLPRCTRGKILRYEPVPTDVEEAGNGTLFVTLLPGGEGPTAVRGKLVRVNPDNGGVKTFAEGFVGATNLALAPGRIFVAELFGGQITSVDRGTREKSTLIQRGPTAAIDFLGGALYASLVEFGEQGQITGDLARITEVLVVD
jgi:hypothetical protein